MHLLSDILPHVSSTTKVASLIGVPGSISSSALASPIVFLNAVSLCAIAKTAEKYFLGRSVSPSACIDLRYQVQPGFLSFRFNSAR